MSPRTEETNARIREEQRERILEAAKAIFAHKGFSETKMSEIAAAANVSYGLAYHYFANKEAIFTKGALAHRKPRRFNSSGKVCLALARALE